MFNKLMFSGLGLMAAVAAPIVFFSVSDHWRGGLAGTPATATPGSVGPAAGSTSGLGAATSAAASPGTPVRGLAEVFQFNVTPDWIMRRWPQVATGLGQLQLQGYRVPLVTGTRESDVAGSLTYYFNAQRQLQRIAFQGNTGDPRQLVGLLSSRFNLTWRADERSGPGGL